MKKLILCTFVVLVSGCTSMKPYEYISHSDSDPKFIFGDRFGGGSIESPARTFVINTKDAVANKCSDLAVIGTTSNHWMYTGEKSKQISAPFGKPIAIRASWLYANHLCVPRGIMFTPVNGGKYSVDVGSISDKCYLSIVQINADGKQVEIRDFQVLPDCVDEQ